MSDSDDVDEDDLDPRVSPSRQISLTRPPRLSSDLAAHYPYCDEEQDVIKQAMRDMVIQHERGITPAELLEKFTIFVAATSGDLEADVGESVRFHCSETDAELELEETEDGVDVSLSIDEDDEE